MELYPQTKPDYEIVISGAGPVGLSLAIALCDLGFECLVVSKDGDFEPQKGNFDGRAYSIAPACWAMWRVFGICEALEPFAQPILKVEAEAANFSPICFDFEEDKEIDGPLGYIVETHAILSALWEKARKTAGLTFKSNTKLSGIKTQSNRVLISLNDDDTKTSSKLLIGCDGRESFVRKTAGIEFAGHDYEAMGIVATVELAKPHEGVARQVFLKGGPFAVLPLKNNLASLVWTERIVVADSLMTLNDLDFELELREKVGDFLGEFTLKSGRFAYPLKMRIADTFSTDRIALAGDAAHTIHPLAGQGLNLGLKDVAALAETIGKAAHVGLDIGSTLALEPYDEWRRADTINMALGMDVLDKMFKAPPALRGLAGFGMSLMGKSELARSFLSREAKGVSGRNMPQLLQGHPIQF